MAYWTDEQAREIQRAYVESLNQRQQKWNQEREQERFKREILAECQKMINEAVAKRLDFLVQDRATPALKELDFTIKNLGRL